MTTAEGYTISVCVDCLQMEANGEVEGPTDRVPLGLLTGEFSLGMVWSEHLCFEEEREGGDCECENLGFSWARCEGCGSLLGGDRYAMTWWGAS